MESSGHMKTGKGNGAVNALIGFSFSLSNGTFDPDHRFLDSLRTGANLHLGWKGHSGVGSLPILSQSTPNASHS